MEKPARSPPIPLNRLWRIVYGLLAAIFFGLAMIGVVLPGIPTTPFLLLMSYFLIRISPALNDRVLDWPVVGTDLQNWQRHGGVRPAAKWAAYGMVTVLVAYSLSSPHLSGVLKIGIAVAAAVGLFVVWRLPTYRGNA